MHSQLHCKLIDELIINVQFLEFNNFFLTTLRHLLSVQRSENTQASFVIIFPSNPRVEHSTAFTIDSGASKFIKFSALLPSSPVE